MHKVKRRIKQFNLKKEIQVSLTVSAAVCVYTLNMYVWDMPCQIPFQHARFFVFLERQKHRAKSTEKMKET